MDIKRLYNDKIYAIVKYWDDGMWNDNEALLYIFENEEELERNIEYWNEEQEYTGCSWRILYKKEK